MTSSRPTTRPILKVLILLVIVALALVVASWFPDLLITLLLSFAVAAVLRPLVEFLELRAGMRRQLAIAVVFVFTGSVLALAGVLGAPVLIVQVESLKESLRGFSLEARMEAAVADLAKGVPLVDPSIITTKFHDAVRTGADALGNIVQAMLGFVVNLAIVPFISYFVLAEGDAALKKTIERIPNKYFEMALNVLYRIKTSLSNWLRGLLLDSAIVASLNALGLSLLGIPHAIIIGVLAGIANLIPFVGPVLGAIVGILVSLMAFGDFSRAVPIVLLTLVIRLLDDIIVQPLCYSKSINMHPVEIVVLLLVGDTLMGITGMVLAIPLATALKSIAGASYWGLKNYRITA